MLPSNIKHICSTVKTSYNISFPSSLFSFSFSFTCSVLFIIFGKIRFNSHYCIESEMEHTDNVFRLLSVIPFFKVLYMPFIQCFLVHRNAHTLHVLLFIHKVPFARSFMIGWTRSTQRYVSIRVGQWAFICCRCPSLLRSPGTEQLAARVCSYHISPTLQHFAPGAVYRIMTGFLFPKPAGETVREADVESSEAGDWRCWCIRSGSQSGSSCASLMILQTQAQDRFTGWRDGKNFSRHTGLLL